MLDLDGQLLAAQRSELDTYDSDITPDVRLQRILAQVLQVEVHIEELRTLVNRPDPTEAPGPVAAALVRASQALQEAVQDPSRPTPSVCPDPARGGAVDLTWELQVKSLRTTTAHRSALLLSRVHFYPSMVPALDPSPPPHIPTTPHSNRTLFSKRN